MKVLFLSFLFTMAIVVRRIHLGIREIIKIINFFTVLFSQYVLPFHFERVEEKWILYVCYYMVDFLTNRHLGCCSTSSL